MVGNRYREGERGRHGNQEGGRERGKVSSQQQELKKRLEAEAFIKCKKYSGPKVINPSGFKVEQCPVGTAPPCVQRNMFQCQESNNIEVVVMIDANVSADSSIHFFFLIGLM